MAALKGPTREHAAGADDEVVVGGGGAKYSHGRLLPYEVIVEELTAEHAPLAAHLGLGPVGPDAREHMLATSRLDSKADGKAFVRRAAPPTTPRAAVEAARMHVGSAEAGPYAELLRLLDAQRRPAMQQFGSVMRSQPPRPPRDPYAQCERLTLQQFDATPPRYPVVLSGAAESVRDFDWASPTRSPFVTAGEGQHLVAFLAPDHLQRVAGQSEDSGRAAFREPVRVRISWPRAVHLATRRKGDADHGCCLKVQNVPFAEADGLLDDRLLDVLERGRAAATDARQLSEDEARGLLVPTIWAHQAGGVTSAHWDEFDSIIVQAAGTRLVSLWPPDLSDALNPLGELPTEQLVAVHDEATGGATGPAEEPDDITFPTAYTTRRCASRAECQVLTLNASETASVAWRVEHFSPLDLSDARAPAATLRCALGPGDALFLPRRWWHRMDDDPTDAHTDVMQVSFSWWFHAWWYNASA